MDRLVKESDFSFLGERTYVHGSTISNDLITIIKQWSLGRLEKISAVFNYPLVTQAQFACFESDSSTQSPKDYPAFFKIKTRKGNFSIAVVPDEKPVNSRVAYDEEGLIRSSEIEANTKTASVKVKSSERILNKIISLNKELLSYLLPQSGYGSWIMARYQVNFTLLSEIEDSLLKLKLDASIGGLSTRTSIFMNDDSVGSIYFSREKLK